MTQDNKMPDYRATCAFSGSKTDLMMYPHRNDNGEMVGWLFACEEVSEKLYSGEYKLTYSLSKSDDLVPEREKSECDLAVTDEAKREALISEIDHTLEYFHDEFPFLEYPQVWCDPISLHAGGVSPNNLVEIKAALQTPSDTQYEALNQNLASMEQTNQALVKKLHALREELEQAKAINQELMSSHDRLLKTVGQISRMRLFPDNGINNMTLSAAIHIATEAITEAEKLQEGK